MTALRPFMAVILESRLMRNRAGVFRPRPCARLVLRSSRVPELTVPQCGLVLRPRREVKQAVAPLFVQTICLLLAASLAITLVPKALRD